VGILLFDDVEVLDFAGPYEVFSRTRLLPGVESRRSEDSAPFRVFTVAAGLDPVVATGGLRVLPDFDFETAPPIDLLVIPGGFGTRALLEDPDTIAWIKRAARSAPRVTSVCTGALLLAKAGLLAGRRATTHWGALEALANLDPSVLVLPNQRVVNDGIVTSAGVSAGIDMAFAVVEAINGRQIADETARYMDYPRGALSQFSPPKPPNP
jgi:transcriptional regulator GlxA family with amidase domain